MTPTTTTSNRLVAYPPDFIGPIADESYYRCNESEWVASNIDEGARCWYRKKYGDVWGDWHPATFKTAWFYDGVIAKVYEDDPDDHIEHTLMLMFGDELRASAP
jgi:hypothetical protein